MKTMTRLMIAGAFAFAFSELSYAQMEAAPPAGATAPAAPEAKPAPKKKALSPELAAKKAKQKECSKKATEKGLHGKERKEFREKCLKGEEE